MGYGGPLGELFKLACPAFLEVLIISEDDQLLTCAGDGDIQSVRAVQEAGSPRIAHG